MRLGFYLESIFVADSNGVMYSNDTYMLILPKLIKEDLSIKIMSRTLPYDPSYAHYPFDDRIQFVPLTEYNSIFHLLTRFPQYLKMNSKTMDVFLSSVDHLVVTTGGPLALVLIKKAIKNKIPCTILVRANARKTIPSRYSGIKKVFASIFTNYIESRIDNLCRKHNLGVIALGKELYDYYSRLSTKCISFASSKYTNKDIVDDLALRELNPNNTLKLLFVGRLVVNKGIGELISALSNFDSLDWHLDIVGDGEYESQIKDLINNFNLQHKISLRGSIPFGDNLKQVYREHDVLILPSYFEGLPQVVLEGMASGCLVLATNVGGIPGVLTHLHSGLLFEPKSSAEILKTLNLLPGLKNILSLKREGLVTARKYSQENQINNFYNILK